MKKIVLGSLFFGLFLVGCSSSQPQEEIVIVEPVVVEEVVIEPVEVATQPLPKPLLDK